MESHSTILDVIQQQLPAGFAVKEQEGNKAAIYSQAERVTPFFKLDTADQREVKVASYVFAESFSLRAPFLGIDLRESEDQRELAAVNSFYNLQTMQRERHNLRQLFNIHDSTDILQAPIPKKSHAR